MNAIPKYVLFNVHKRDEHGNALLVAYGNDAFDLLTTYEGKAYQIMEVMPVDQWRQKSNDYN